MSDNQVIEATGFAAGAHPRGAILSVLRGDAVVANIRLNPSSVWLLQRALHECLIEQAVLEQRARRDNAGELE
jgi:hypothetical protein